MMRVRSVLSIKHQVELTLSTILDLISKNAKDKQTKKVKENKVNFCSVGFKL
jgi:hypothetical protein